MAVDRPVSDKIRKLLQSEEVQKRIQENIRKGGEDAKVTIGRAAELFGLKQAKLRELDKLLNPERSGDNPIGQRRYSLTELRKIAIISELLKEGCAVAEIPTAIDEIWEQVTYQESPQELETSQVTAIQSYFINRRIEEARTTLFWRFFASKLLRQALHLICEDLPGTTVALILPFHFSVPVTSMHDLSKIDLALIGWLSRSHSSHTLLVSHPDFEYKTDYRLLPLVAMKDEEAQEAPEDATLILLDRRARPLTLNNNVVAVIRDLLKALYMHQVILQRLFGVGMRDQLEPSTDVESTANYTDAILDELANEILFFGGQTTKQLPRWRFCNILLPLATRLPLHQRSLVVRARSKNSPHRIGVAVSPSDALMALSIRAMQSGNIVYRANISPGSEGMMVAFGEKEGPIRSAVAIPIGSERGQPLAVLYIVSDEEEAFSFHQRGILRLIGRLIGELLETYTARNRTGQDLNSCLYNPDVVDSIFEYFASENAFYKDIEHILMLTALSLKKRKNQHEENDIVDLEQDMGGVEKGSIRTALSLIAVEVDKTENIAFMFGDEIVRHLSREVGLQLQRQYRALFAHAGELQPYYIYGSRFYLLLKDISLEEARIKAERLRVSLASGKYSVEAPLMTRELPPITVHLGVGHYTQAKLEELLGRYSTNAIIGVRTLIMIFLDDILKLGQKEGGDVVMSWDFGLHAIIRSSPPLPPTFPLP